MAEPRRNDEPQREEFRNGGASPRRRLTRERRRALELLARDPYGVTEELMLAKWFTVTMLAGLVRDGLAIARRDVVKAATKTPKVGRYCITNAGRRALEG
jgi:hypothetical protein